MCAIACVYLGAARLAISRLRGWRPLRTRSRILETGFYVAALLGSACILYAFTVEPYWPQVTYVHLTSAKLRGPIRIVHISDLHCDGKVRLERRLPELIRAEHPDLIAFTGDTMVNRAGVPLAKEVLSRLAAIAPTYVVAGNWDVELAREWRQDIRHPDFFAGTGVHNLTGSGEALEIHGNPLWVMGAAFNSQDALPRLLQTASPERFSVFLYHIPDEVEMVRKSKTDLYLAGHTHGGQIALPFYGALITYSRYDKMYESGLHRIGDFWLYVNRGIGMEGHAPRARFFARPEITVIDVGPADQAR